MKKIIKSLTALGTAALAIVGGVYIFRKFFAKDEELDEVFDDEDLFGEDDEDKEEESFDDDLEIFEDDAEEVEASEDTETETVEKAVPEKDAKAASSEEED